MSEHTPRMEDAKNQTTVSTDQSTHELPNRAGKNLRDGGLFNISLTHVVLLLLIITFLWQWLEGQRTINDMQRQLAERISEMSANNKAAQMLVTQSQDQMRDLAVKVSLMEARYAEAQNQRAALEALYNDLSVNRDELVLAEVEQMLLNAEQQLQLSANVKAALIAMQSSDARLQRLDRTEFNGLRKAIGQDMDKLRALPSLDVVGINLQLNNLISIVNELPLDYQKRVENQMVQKSVQLEEGATWKKLLHEIWSELKQLVIIENTGKAELPLLSPDQEFFLRENLKLRLLSARLALLSRDESSFRQELKTAQYWISHYFDGNSKQGARALVDLKQLVASHIIVKLPDISGSLLAVRNYRTRQEHMAERSLSKKGVR